MVTPPQTSAQAPAAVEQPEPALQFAVQHTLPGPTAQVVAAAVHEQSLQVSALPLQKRVQLAG
jgi:hypothetical protein